MEAGLKEFIHKRVVERDHSWWAIRAEFDECVKLYVSKWYENSGSELVSLINFDAIDIRYSFDGSHIDSQIYYKNLYSYLVIKEHIVVPHYNWIDEGRFRFKDKVYIEVGLEKYATRSVANGNGIVIL